MYLWFWSLFAFVIVKFICICDVVDISIWTACDAYCELSVMDVMFIWMWYVAATEPNKLIIYGSFAECNTRQRGLLPSSRVKTLGKCTRGKILCILGLKWLLCRVSALWHSAKKPTLVRSGPAFAECLRVDTRQRRKLCRVQVVWQTAKGGRFAECWEFDTWQNEKALPSVWELTLGKEGSFAECLELDTW